MFKKVLFPTDFSSGSEKAAEKFEKQNQLLIGELVLLHVVDESIFEELTNGFSLLYNSEEEELSDIKNKLKVKAMDKLDEEEKRCQKMFKTKKVKKIVKFGLPYRKIVETAEKENASLIILPSHGKMGFSKEFLGSTTIRVLKMTNRPVLILKTEDA
jgi:nucleotide-binding universal stress UspA family protein